MCATNIRFSHSRNSRSRLRHDNATSPTTAPHQNVRIGRGRRDVVARFQRPNPRRIQDAQRRRPGHFVVRHDAARRAGRDEIFYAQPDPHPRQKRGADAGRYQAVLRLCGERGLETGNLVRSVRHIIDYAGGNLLQYAAQGGLVDGEHA